MLERVKDSVSRRARRLSRHSISALRSPSRETPSSSHNGNSPSQHATSEFPQHPGVNPIADKPLPHRPNLETQRRSLDDEFTQHPAINPLHSGPAPRSAVPESPRQSLAAHRTRPSNGGQDEVLNFSEIISEHPALNPLGSELAPRSENQRHSRTSSTAQSHHGDGRVSNSFERNRYSTSSDAQRHLINDQYVPQRSGSRRQSQGSQRQSFDAPPLEESLKKPLPLEPIPAGQTPMEIPSYEPRFPEPVTRKPVAADSTQEPTARKSRVVEGSFQTEPSREGAVPGAWPSDDTSMPPPLEVSAEILHHVDAHLTTNAEASSTSSSRESNALDNEQHYKLVNEDNFHATTKDVVATDEAGTDFRAPQAADFDESRHHKDIYFDHEVHHRNAAIDEHIKPHVHTIYEPKRTRSIHYHEHRQVIQPISDPEPIVKPAAHWAEDHRTGEIFKIPDALGEQLLENSYAEFKRIDGCNIYGDNYPSDFAKPQTSEMVERSAAQARDQIIEQRLFPDQNEDAGNFEKSNMDNRDVTLGDFPRPPAGTTARDYSHKEGAFNDEAGFGSSTTGKRPFQEGGLQGRGNIASDFEKLNINDQHHTPERQNITDQSQPLGGQDTRGRALGRSSTDASHNLEARRPGSALSDPRQSPPPVREFRMHRPSLVPDV